MKLHHDLNGEGQSAPIVLAIGFFDGFHRGHAAILRKTLALRRPGHRCAVLTFANHPATFLRPGSEPPLLTTLEERLALLGLHGVEECYAPRFGEAIATLSREDFVERVLLDALRARAVVVGDNFRFGSGRSGDVAFARPRLEAAGVALHSVANEMHAGERISSTRIRAAVAAGQLAESEAMLGHAYELSGRVVVGEGRGHALGWPTANLDVAEEKLLPGDGVYAGVARHDGRDYAALISIGTNPTFAGTRRTVEAWLRDFQGTIYGQELRLRDLRFLRAQQQFASAQALSTAMQEDAAHVHYPAFL